MFLPKEVDCFHDGLGHTRVVAWMPSSTIHFVIGKVNKFCGQCNFHYNFKDEILRLDNSNCQYKLIICDTNVSQCKFNP
jgi:hypothetical protein